MTSVHSLFLKTWFLIQGEPSMICFFATCCLHQILVQPFWIFQRSAPAATSLSVLHVESRFLQKKISSIFEGNLLTVDPCPQNFTNVVKLKTAAEHWVSLKKNFMTTDRKNGNKNCLNELNELKFCEVSLSNRS